MRRHGIASRLRMKWRLERQLQTDMSAANLLILKKLVDPRA
jgi:hypothetical protein